MMKHTISILCILLSWSALGQTTSKNYVKTVTARQATTNPIIHSASNDATMQSIQYVDGLGRPEQTIVRWGAGNGNDMVTPIVYDQFGRQVKSYLSYEAGQVSGNFRSNAHSEHTSAYVAQYGIDGNHAYSEVAYEPSPLNRMEHQAAPGDDWKESGPHTIDYLYEANTATEVRLFDFDDLLVGSGDHYSAMELYKNTVNDEAGNITVEYVDKRGLTVLKKVHEKLENEWLETHYIYDNLNRLCVVLPPNAAALLATEFYPGNATSRQQFLNRWAFQYEYDDRNRMVKKQVPGAEVVFMVYDQWDRLVLTQDGAQRLNDEWLFTSYDALNRPVITGILQDTNPAHQSQDGMQVWIMGLGDRSLSFSSGATNHQYTQAAYPFSQVSDPNIDVVEVLTVTYYDTYDFNGSHGYTDYPFATDLFHLDPQLQNPVKGQVTGTKTKMLQRNTGTDADYLTTITHYDNRYRAIKVTSDNHLGGTDVVSTQYDFMGNVRRVHSSHYDGTTTIEQLLEYDYDHVNRLLSCDHTFLNQNQKTRLFTNQYNELGELTDKQLHRPDGENNYAQSLDYAYNIRGWLKSINESGLSGSSATPDPDDLFKMELFYTDPVSGVPNQ